MTRRQRREKAVVVVVVVVGRQVIMYLKCHSYSLERVVDCHVTKFELFISTYHHHHQSSSCPCSKSHKIVRIRRVGCVDKL